VEKKVISHLFPHFLLQYLGEHAKEITGHREKTLLAWLVLHEPVFRKTLIKSINIINDASRQVAIGVGAPRKEIRINHLN